jgi:hypothetical protein
MKTLQSKCSLCLWFFLIVLVFSGGCAMLTKGPPPAPIRKICGIGRVPLYDLIIDVFREDGYDILLQIPDGGYFETTWKKKRVKRIFKPDFYQRGKYEVTLVRDFSKLDVFHFHLKPKVEQRALHPDSHWKIPREKELKDLLYGSDSDYIYFLKKIEDAVSEKGGGIYKGE